MSEWLKWSQTRLLVTLGISYLLFAETVSLTLSDGPTCIVDPAKYGSYYADNNECPALHVFLFKFLAAILEKLGDPNWVIAIFTVVLAGSTIGLWLSTNKLWGAGEKQFRHARRTAIIQSRQMQASIDVAERALVAGQRPWIHVDMAITGDMVFDDSGSARLPLVFILTNIGRSPATNVRVNPCIFIRGPRHSDPRREHQIYCDIVRMRSDTMLSYTLFPDEDPKRIEHFETIGSAQIEEHKESWRGIAGDEMKHFSPVIVGCVSYSIPFDDRQHQTGFMAELKRRLTGQPPALMWGMFNTDEKTVPRDEMRLFYSPYGSPHID